MMPQKNSGLAILEDFLYESNAIDTTRRYRNLFDQVIENIDEARHKKLKQSIDVEMPMFTIESDIPVIDHMKKVNIYFRYFLAPIVAWPFLSNRAYVFEKVVFHHSIDGCQSSI